MTIIEAILLTIITASTPLLLAAIGELVVERSGVLNLGVEGMMIVGAVMAFAGAYTTGSTLVGAICAMLAGMVMATLFGFLTLKLVTNQIVTGLALTLFGLGLSGLIGENFIGIPGIKISELYIPVLTDLPFIGKILFGQDLLVYLSVALVILVWKVLFGTRIGLIIRAIGDNHHSAHSLGYSVNSVRFYCVLFGGACAGLGGGYLSLAYTPQWTEGMTAGRGWIALALVVFSSWRPQRIAFGAYLFGAFTILQFHAQAYDIAIPSQFLTALPYLATIIVLVVISNNKFLLRTNTPSCLAQPFVPDR